MLGILTDIPRKLRESTRIWDQTAADDELRYTYSLWASYPILDSVYFIRSRQNNYLELFELEKKPSLEGLYFGRRLPTKGDGELWPPSDFALSPEYCDEELGVFRFYFAARPTLQSVDMGLRIASEAIESGAEQIGRWLDITFKCKPFIESTLSSQVTHSWVGAFSALGKEPGVFGTYVAISAVTSYQKIRERFDILPKIDFPIQFSEVLTGLKKEDFIFCNDSSFAFKQRGDDDGCLSTTFYGYSVLDLLERYRLLGDDASEYVKMKKEGPWSNGLAALQFLHDCWDEKEGGFKSQPNGVANIGHTRYGLQVLRLLLDKGFIAPRDFPKWLDAAKVLEFLHSCWDDSKSDPGFKNTRHDLAPSACAERAGVSTIKLLEIFKRNKNLLSVDEKRYGRRLKKLKRLLRGSYKLVGKLYMDTVDGVCYAYPMQMVETRLPHSVVFSTIRGIANFALQALLHPLSSVEIDRRTGKVVER